MRLSLATLSGYCLKRRGELWPCFSQALEPQSLYWLHRPSVETAYVNHLIAEGGLSMAQRWEDQSVGHKRHSDYDTGLAFQSAKENWALSWLDGIGVAPQSTVYFAVSQGRAPAPFLKHLADEGRLPETSQLLTIDERVRPAEVAGTSRG